MRSMACLLAVAALAAAGCGGGGKSGGSASSGSSSTPTSTPTSTPSSSSASASGGGHSVPVAASPTQLKFTTQTLKAKSGTVTFDFKNPSTSIPHGLAVEGHGVDKHSKIVTNGSSTLTVKLKPGKYEFYCPVPGHKAAGMEGTLVVS